MAAVNADLIAALEREKAGYLVWGNTAQAAEADAQIKLLRKAKAPARAKPAATRKPKAS